MPGSEGYNKFRMVKIDSRFIRGYEAIKALAELPRYEAAFIFGSVAEGTSTDKSDLDVRVVVDEEEPCNNVNHPVIDGYKMDLSFKPFSQIQAETEKDMERAERKPVLAGSVIVFDKTGQITDLKKRAEKVVPKNLTEADYLFTQFMLYHANDKVERYIVDDPISSLYSMHANIGDVLKYHYQLHGRWWVSSKRILSDLASWDQELAQLVKKFVVSSEIKEKHSYWLAIMDHATAVMGGRQPIAENNCDCEVCKTDLAVLAQSIKG
jgi:predicted nucleotidyltransferase